MKIYQRLLESLVAPLLSALLLGIVFVTVGSSEPHAVNDGNRDIVTVGQEGEKATPDRLAPWTVGSDSLGPSGGIHAAWTTPLFDSSGHTVGFNDTWTMALVVVDLDGDGDPDLATAEIDGRIMAWQNDGTPFAGGWTGHQVGVTDPWWTLLALAAGDLDNDGDMDLVAGNYYHHGPLIWENDGSPFEGEWSWREIGEQNVGALALADVDGDGRLDIVAGGGLPWDNVPSEDNRIMVWHAPEAPFSDPWQATDVGLAYYSVLGLDVGDLDNDGDNDIVIGTWPAPAVGDVDNPVPRDQWPDVYQIRAFRNDGGDHWTGFNVGRDPKIETLEFVSYSGFWGATVTHVALADLDNDGDLDIAATERSTGDFLVMAWQNDGTPFSGELWAPTAVAIGEQHHWLNAHVWWVEPGDFDRDGDLDLVSGCGPRESYQVMVWENTGEAFGTVITDTAWVRHNVGVLGEEAHTGGVADFDGDGYLDIVAGACVSESNEIRLWENYGQPIPRIQCQPGYTAILYAQGLSSPDGLAFDPSGVLHVAEEAAGRVSRIEPSGSITTVADGLTNPEGIAFDSAGNLYVVEDVQNGRLVRVAPGGGKTDLATGRDAPEGVVWTSGGTTYITESNVEFTTPNFYDFRTRVTAVSPVGEVTTILTDTLYWSYAGITIGADGLLYVTNEASGTGTTDSIFTVDPVTGERTLFASGLVTPEGLRFAANGDFPLYVAEEDIGDGTGRLSRVKADGSHEPFCTGFYGIEDVAVDERGRLYVSEDSSGWIIVIKESPYQTYLPVVLRAYPQ